MQNLKLLAFILFVGGAASLNAQTIEAFAFSGYTFRNSFNITGGEASFDDGHTFGGSVDFVLNPNYAIELYYSRQQTRAEARSIFFNENYSNDASISYIMLGGQRIFPASDEDFQYYGGLRLGVVILASDENRFTDVSRFAVGPNAGIKYFFNDLLGVRLAVNLNFPITDVGAGLYWSNGGGTQVGLSSYSPIAQFAFNGGLVLRFN